MNLRRTKPDPYARFIGTDVTFFCTATQKWARVRYYGGGRWNVQHVEPPK